MAKFPLRRRRDPHPATAPAEPEPDDAFCGLTDNALIRELAFGAPGEVDRIVLLLQIALEVLDQQGDHAAAAHVCTALDAYLARGGAGGQSIH